MRYVSDGGNTAGFKHQDGNDKQRSKCRPIIVDHFCAPGRTGYRGSEEITNPRKGIMWRMHAILTRAGGGQTLDSPFFFNGSIPSAGECEKISSGVSAEGSENAGQSPSEAPRALTPGIWKIGPPVKSRQSSRAFFKREMSVGLRASHSKEAFKPSAEPRSRPLMYFKERSDC